MNTELPKGVTSCTTLINGGIAVRFTVETQSGVFSKCIAKNYSEPMYRVNYGDWVITPDDSRPAKLAWKKINQYTDALKEVIDVLLCTESHSIDYYRLDGYIIDTVLNMRISEETQLWINKHKQYTDKDIQEKVNSLNSLMRSLSAVRWERKNGMFRLYQPYNAHTTTTLILSLNESDFMISLDTFYKAYEMGYDDGYDEGRITEW